MSTYGSKTRHLFRLEVKWQRSYEDDGGVRFSQEVKVELEIGRREIEISFIRQPKRKGWCWIRGNNDYVLAGVPRLGFAEVSTWKHNHKYQYSGDYNERTEEWYRD